MAESRRSFMDDICDSLSELAEREALTYVDAATLSAFYQDVAQAPRRASKPQFTSAPSSAPTPFSDHSSSITRAPVEASPVSVDADISTLDLEGLSRVVAGCQKCGLSAKRNHTVFGEGYSEADLMFIGEGPGYDEDQQGRPFVGKAGQLLTKMINAMGFERPEVYIANIVKCRPPGNRNPEPGEAELCLPYLKRQIDLIQPKVIILLGAVPLRFLLDKTGITRLHGQWLDYNGVPTMPIFHPAYLLRNPGGKRPVWAALQEVMRVFGKTYIPPRKG